jgi:hypothetical protein
MRTLAEIDRKKLVGMLADRLAFERAAAARYRAVLPELRGAEPAVLRIVPRLEQQLVEEEDHARWLEAELTRLEAPLELVRAPAERGQRDCDALFGDRGGSVIELVSALHRLELGDLEGWDLLVAVAERAGDEPARRELGLRRGEEARHVEYLHRVLVELAVNHALGHPVTLPAAP